MLTPRPGQREKRLRTATWPFLSKSSKSFVSNSILSATKSGGSPSKCLELFRETSIDFELAGKSAEDCIMFIPSIELVSRGEVITTVGTRLGDSKIADLHALDWP